MSKIVDSALFIYTPDSANLLTHIKEQSGAARVKSIEYDEFLSSPLEALQGEGHVVVSASIGQIKKILRYAHQHKFSVGIIPDASQGDLIRYYDLPRDRAAAINLALQTDAPAMDLTLCNDEVLMFMAVIGRLPLLDKPRNIRGFNRFISAMTGLRKLRLGLLEVRTTGGGKIVTAASGCMLLQHHTGSLASRLIAHDSSPSDGMISMVISAPKSIIEYVGFLNRLRKPIGVEKRLPKAIGYIKSAWLDIQTQNELPVFIDGEKITQTPLRCETIPSAVRINIGPRLRKEGLQNKPSKETIRIDHLPRDKEVVKAQNKNIPFFSYASETRFRELFTSLRADAKIDKIYIVLMILSSMLATVGLYLNSASVIIGAMLLAPLMAPIISLAMGILRNDESIIKNSFIKIVMGVAIALSASALITLMFPHKPLTEEMQARLNPTLLDLAVAILSGVAGAYSKSFREIIQSLAGVAIAVALVPPLAVAGTGIGRLDIHFFSQAFLLFATNLIGIVLAASFSFRVLGYSAAIHSKRNVFIVVLFLALIAIPLYLSYDRIVETAVYEKNWRKERFLVNDKYIIIQNAKISRRGKKRVITMDILARDLLTRHDLNEFKRKIQTNFSENLVIRARTIYIP